MDDLKRVLINAGIYEDTKELIREYTKTQKRTKNKTKKVIKESAVVLNADDSNYDEWVTENLHDTYKENYKNYLKEYGERQESDPAKVRDAASLFGELSDNAPNDESSQKEALMTAANKYGVKPFEIEKQLGRRVGAKQEHIREEGEPTDVPTPTLDELKKKYKNIDPKVLDKELEMGIKEELEHTTDRKKAREVALDHLAEKPHYYTKLKIAMKEGFKNTYETGDRVNTPLGTGTIIDMVERGTNNQLHPLIKLDKSDDPDGDTFWLPSTMLTHLDETAGVGLNAEFNTYPYTPDIKKGSLKKAGKQMGFDITDTGIPPRISQNSINK